MMNAKHILLLSISLLMSVGLFLMPAIPQDIQYHNFADQRTMLGVPNFFNVISNLPYLLFGYLGAFLVLTETSLKSIKSIKYIYILFFVGVAIVCFGSGYYHLNPSNHTLLWDRLPMTIAFMSFFSIVLAEYVSLKTAKKAFFPLLLLGLISVLYWYWSETIGRGDLRLYILVQFLPVILIPLMLLMFKSIFTHSIYFWFMTVCYVLAKIFELTDQAFFELFEVISGHTMKHLVSSLAPYLFYLSLKERRLSATNCYSQY